MCIEVVVGKGDDNAVVCTTRDELESALGGRAVGYGTFEDDWKSDDCLCHCDLLGTATRFGYKASVVNSNRFEFRKVVHAVLS